MAEEELSFGVGYCETHAAKKFTLRAGSNYITRRWGIGGSLVTMGRPFELTIAPRERRRSLFTTAAPMFLTLVPCLPAYIG